MADIVKTVGENIRYYRKLKGLTLEQLGARIGKTKAAVSKYENGRIFIDIQTLYEIAETLCIDIEQLLYSDDRVMNTPAGGNVPNFFKDISMLYGYIFDGRDGRVSESVITIGDGRDAAENTYLASLYLNIRDAAHFHVCEYTYRGKLCHYDSLSVFTLQNTSTPMEELKITVPASFMDEPEKFAMFCGISSRPVMPVALKILLCKSAKEKSADLAAKLKIGRNDIKNTKIYNMFSVT